MHSQRLIFRSHGKPAEVLELEDFSPPPLKAGEVLLAIHAAPINPADLNFIEGTYGFKPMLPACAGMECCASVVASRSDKFTPGDQVIPVAQIGSWATHAVTSQENLIKIPSGIAPLQAAMLKVNPATAWLLLHRFADLEKGDTVVLNAANSGVGQCVIQLAADLGFRSVCFLRDEKHFPALKDLGASYLFPDSAEGFDEAKATLKNHRARLAFNAVGGESALRLMKLLSDGATHITYGAMGRKPLTIPNGSLIFSDIRIRGLWVTKWMESASRGELESTYAQLAQRLEKHTLMQHVDSTFTLSDFPQALERLEASGRNGKVLFENQLTN